MLSNRNHIWRPIYTISFKNVINQNKIMGSNTYWLYRQFIGRHENPQLEITDYFTKDRFACLLDLRFQFLKEDEYKIDYL